MPAEIPTITVGPYCFWPLRTIEMSVWFKDDTSCMSSSAFRFRIGRWFLACCLSDEWVVRRAATR